MLTALIAARGLRWGSNYLRDLVRDHVHPEEAAQITTWWYERARRYKTDNWQQSGLLHFEEAAIARCFPTPPARVLVLGCGGGRELVALRARGYECAASDPSAALCEVARHCTGHDAAIRIGGIEACAQHRADGPFDAVLVGWSAWGYVLQSTSRVQALRDLRSLCPNGPVMLSWQLLKPPSLHDDPTSTAVDLRATDARWRRDLKISPGRGITAQLSTRQVIAEGQEAGYQLQLDGTARTAYPHVVLAPQ